VEPVLNTNENVITNENELLNKDVKEIMLTEELTFELNQLLTEQNEIIKSDNDKINSD